MARDRERQREWRRHQRDKMIRRKYGQESVRLNMSGRHSNHARGPANARWNPSNRRVLSNGYVAVRVPVDHPHAWGPPNLKRFRYAYEHTCVAMQILGRPLRENEIVHHRNGNKKDNRKCNIEITTSSKHQRFHANHTRQRDRHGRFM